jgi:hypothetical protein
MRSETNKKRKRSKPVSGKIAYKLTPAEQRAMQAIRKLVEHPKAR